MCCSVWATFCETRCPTFMCSTSTWLYSLLRTIIDVRHTHLVAQDLGWEEDASVVCDSALSFWTSVFQKLSRWQSWTRLTASIQTCLQVHVWSCLRCSRIHVLQKHFAVPITPRHHHLCEHTPDWQHPTTVSLSFSRHPIFTSTLLLLFFYCDCTSASGNSVPAGEVLAKQIATPPPLHRGIPTPTKTLEQISKSLR